MIKNISESEYRSKRQNGFSLIEVLISMVLLAFGMLGMAGLFNYSVSANSNASNRMAAALLATDYAELVRANPDSITTNTYNRVIPGFDPTKYVIDSFTASNFCSYPNCKSSTNTAVSTETLDIALFRNRVKSMLPAGDFQATRVAGSNQIDIWIVWAESKDSDKNADKEKQSDNCPVSISNQDPAPVPYPRCLFTRVAL